MDNLHNKIFLKHIIDRIKNNQNYIAVVIGQTGSGKTYQTLRLCEKLAPFLGTSFTIDNNVAFTAQEFMDMLQDESRPRGTILFWDEVGVGMGSRNFASATNKLISSVLQTFRIKNTVLFLNLPHLSMVDTHVRKLLHGILKTMSIDRYKNIGKLRPYCIEVNPEDPKGDYYRKFLKVKVRGNKTVVKELQLKMPTLALRKEYEKKKAKFTQDMYEGIRNELENASGAIPTARLTIQQQEIYDIKVDSPNITHKEIGEMLNCTPQNISIALKAIQKKGFDVPLADRRVNSLKSKTSIKT